MIITFVTNNNPMNLSGISVVQPATAIAFTSGENQIEYCSCNDCEFYEYAFYSTDVAEHKNDKSSFLVRKVVSTETWTFKLFKEGVFKTNITNGTYGTFYDFGDLLYSNLKGLIIDWGLVANTYGNGSYMVRIEKVFAGTTTTFDSHEYRVMPYNAEVAAGTVKIQSVQNGTFLGTGYTFRNLEWEQSIRVFGMLRNKTPKVEVNEYVDSSRNRQQVYDKMVNTYTLELRMLPSFIANTIIYGQAMANELFVTDYNRYAFEVYRKLPVRLAEISSSEYYEQSRRGSFEIVLTDKSEGTIKSY